MEVNRMIDGIRATNMELVDVLTAISQVSMRLAVKLEMLEKAELKKKIKENLLLFQSVFHKKRMYPSLKNRWKKMKETSERQ